MPGPTGAAPQTTESIGDPDAGDPAAAVQGGAAAGAVLGTVVAGPIGLAAGAAIGAVTGGAAAPGGAGDRHPADDQPTARTAAETQRGARTPGPPTAGDDIPVVDTLTEMTEDPTRADPRRRA
jgi:hypothetical protein